MNNQPPIAITDQINAESSFRWKRIGSSLELESFYASILPQIRKAARDLGYAVAVHGSMRRDLDLVAVPWIEKHANEQELCAAIHLAACGLKQHNYDIRGDKPLGRRCIMFPICWLDYSGAKDGSGHIDLSICKPTEPISCTDQIVRQQEEIERLTKEHSELLTRRAELLGEVDQLKAEREELKKKLLNSCDIKHFLLVKDQLAAWKEMANESVTVIRDTPFNSSKRDAVVEKFNQMKEGG